MASVIWISGYSGAGKTTVGRKVDELLRDRGVIAIHLDGDDLRAVLGGQWGYSREERTELARVYFRLCSHLASQGLVVIISAIAMYDEVRDWLRTHVSGAVEVYLDVPESERRRRDRLTKGIYDQIGGAGPGYDEPSQPDLLLRNYGDLSADTAAEAIADFTLHDRRRLDAEHGRVDHWNTFYSSSSAPKNPSTFAASVAGELATGTKLLEVGCGNGRDTALLGSRCETVLALDTSADAIAAARAALADVRNLSFFVGTVADLPRSVGKFDAVYSRFCLHAMTDAEEAEFLAHSHDLMSPGARLLLECRSINDPLARHGEIVSRNERIHGHYRRFVIPQVLRDRLAKHGFEILSFEESAGLTPLGDDDPVVIRAYATKPGG